MINYKEVKDIDERIKNCKFNNISDVRELISYIVTRQADYFLFVEGTKEFEIFNALQSMHNMLEYGIAKYNNHQNIELENISFGAKQYWLEITNQPILDNLGN